MLFPYVCFVVELSFLLMVKSFNGAVLKSTGMSDIPSDWKSYIHPDMLEQYLGKKADDKFTDGLLEGDITGFDEKETGSQLHEIARNAVTDEKLRWPEGIVPFTISTVFRPFESEIITNAMKAMSGKTDGSVTFIERTNQTDYIYITNNMNCFSRVGRQGGQQKISLSRGCLENLGDIQHELMHALGFFHEMSRVDRDDYVWINWPNVQQDKVDQFAKYTKGTSTLGLSYDYESVLHYPFTAFAVNKSAPTIVPKQPRARIGQNKNLSPGDIKKIQLLYGQPIVISLGDLHVQIELPAQTISPSKEPLGQSSSTSVNWDGKSWAYNCDFLGNDIASYQIAPQFCGPKCVENTACSNFVFNQGTCYLKGGQKQKSDAIFHEVPGQICGVIESSINWDGKNWAFNCDFVGDNFASLRIGPESCGPKCFENPECTHFTFSHGMCSLKKGFKTKDDAIFFKEEGRVCGIK